MPGPTVYQYPKCSTCRKALAYLDAQGVTYESIDIVQRPPSRAQLAAALKQSGLPLKRFFNSSGQSYRDGKFGERLPQMSEQEALDALAADGKLIKRPLLLGKGFVLLGFDAEQYRERFE
ncbi:MAG TPA: arsenate reductase family protein [Polyangiaceae bacterium]|nr:arsenate reductase family protein [Polyangiaceae bacterium]